jgi:Fic family protein
MLIPPKYHLTEKISQLLSSIEASKQVIDSINLDPKIEFNIKRQSSLKSSLYSARIEGNPLTLADVDTLNSHDRKKNEVFNLLKAYSYLKDISNKSITRQEIIRLHNIAVSPSEFRTNMEAIFNSAGIAIYMPPPPRMVDPLINRLIKYANSDKEKFVAIKAVLTHYVFEKIHPFLDGNGRVGRLLIQKVLDLGGYGMKGLLPLEEYLDNHRSVYYRGLEDPERDTTFYIEFMLEAIAETAVTAKEQVLAKQEPQIEDYLLPRRAEILRIIKDHKITSFDQIRRRFLKVNERTLRYDLKKLQDQRLIKKLGNTRGAIYTPY